MIPPNARVVYRGVLFSVLAWEQELFDGSTAIFERVKRPDTVQVLPIVNGKLLLSHEEQPGGIKRVGFFGGRVEENEEALDAAKRELREETGLTGGEWMKMSEVKPLSKLEWTITLYIVRGCEKTNETQLDAGERITVREYSYEEIREGVVSGELNLWDFGDRLLRAVAQNKEVEFRKNIFEK